MLRPRGQCVIETAGTDIVCPAVTADQPDTAMHELIGKRYQMACRRAVEAG